MGGRQTLDKRGFGLRRMHGALWDRHSPGPTSEDLLVPQRRFRPVRPVHRCQLLSDMHHSRQAHHTRLLHQRVWVAVAGTGHGQPHRTTACRSVNFI